MQKNHFLKQFLNNFYTKIKLFSFRHISDVCKQKQVILS